MKERLEIHSEKLLRKQYPLLRSFRVQFIGQPFIPNHEFISQLFDNTFADIAERSNVIGIDGNNNGSHNRPSKRLGNISACIIDTKSKVCARFRHVNTIPNRTISNIFHFSVDTAPLTA